MVEKWEQMTNEELALEYQQTNNEDLFEYFIKRNRNLIFYYARRVLRHHPNWKDAIEQQGRLACWKALKKFDNTKEAKFSTYFHYYMLRALQLQFREYHSIQLPFHVVINLERHMEKYPNAIFQIGSLDEVLLDTDKETQLGDLIASDINIEEDTNTKFIKENLLKHIHKLSPREAHIVDSYFGISDGIPKTLQILGDEYHVTRERIRQIIAKALNKLRIYYKIEGDPRDIN